MKNKEKVTISGIIQKLGNGFAILSSFNGFSPSHKHNLVAGIIGAGMVGLYMSLRAGNKVSEPSLSDKKDSADIVQTVAGLQNIGNNCFLNVILQALASCSCFIPFLQNILDSSDVTIEEKHEILPLAVALSSLLEELHITRDEKAVFNPRRVMLAMSSYVSSFSLTRQQDAAEAFLHLLTSLEEEISQCYVLHESSLIDATALPSRIYMPKLEGQSECERWKQQFLGPFDGTIGSSLTCTNCSSMLSMDFDHFRCLSLSPMLDRTAEIVNDCTLGDCFRQFTEVEYVSNYRCSRCWHIAALKYLSERTEKDEVRVKMLDQCIKLDSCDCRGLFLQDEISWTGFSRVLKQLNIARCPRILCIQLQRASINEHGELIKLQGHISFPLFLDLFPFTQIRTNVEQRSLGQYARTHEKQQWHPLVSQICHPNKQYGLHMIPQIYKILGESIPSETLPISKLGKSEPSEHPSNETISRDNNKNMVTGNEMDSCDLHGSPAGSIKESEFSNKVHVGSIGSSNSSKSCMYCLSSVVEHYGKPGGGHYAVYRRMGSESGAGAGNCCWAYVSDHLVSIVSEEEVLSAEATLLFYERIQG